MSAHPSTYRSWLVRLELALSVLVLAALAMHASLDAFGELTLTVGFVAPVLLGAAALAGSGFDAYRLVTNRAALSRRRSRLTAVGQFLAVGVVGLLATIILWLVVQTLLVTTVVDTGGGVIMGPFFWTVVGSLLAVAILVRAAVGMFLVDLPPIHRTAAE